MESANNVLTRLVPITLFNRGQASRIFDRLHSEPELIVLKNNQPSAVILSPDEYARLSEIEENYMLLQEATRRIIANGDKPSIRNEEVMSRFGITASDMENAEDIEIE